MLKVGRDQHAREDALVVAEPRHGNCKSSHVSFALSNNTNKSCAFLPALTTVMHVSSQVPLRLLKSPIVDYREQEAGLGNNVRCLKMDGLGP